MGPGSIPLNVSTESLSSSAFQITQSLGTPIEQAQPNPLNELQNQTDPVTISSEALELSSKPGSQNSKQ